MLVSGPEIRSSLVEILKKAKSLGSVVHVSHDKSLAGLLEHEPTHVIWQWQDEKQRGKDCGQDWEVFLTNAQMLGIKVTFLSWLPARVLPEVIRPSFLRLPVRVNEIVATLSNGGE